MTLVTTVTSLPSCWLNHLLESSLGPCLNQCLRFTISWLAQAPGSVVFSAAAVISAMLTMYPNLIAFFLIRLTSYRKSSCIKVTPVALAVSSLEAASVKLKIALAAVVAARYSMPFSLSEIYWNAAHCMDCMIAPRRSFSFAL